MAGPQTLFELSGPDLTPAKMRDAALILIDIQNGGVTLLSSVVSHSFDPSHTINYGVNDEMHTLQDSDGRTSEQPPVV